MPLPTCKNKSIAMQKGWHDVENRKDDADDQDGCLCCELPDPFQRLHLKAVLD
jgi:hypothetical protein